MKLPAMGRSTLRDAAGLALVVVLLAAPIFTWGMPRASASDRVHAWGNDDQVPLAPLAELHNALIEARPDRNLAYPMMHYLVLGAAYAPYLGALWLTGGLEHPTGIYPFGLSDPVRAFTVLSWIGRSVSVLLAVAAVLGAWFAARELFGRSAGLLSGLTLLLCFPFVYYAPLGNLDVPVLGWTSLGLAACASILRYGFTPGRAALLGAFVAFAGATKDQSAGSFFLLVPAMLVLHFRSGDAHRLRGFHGRLVGPAVAAVSLLVAYVLASGIPIDPKRWVQHVGLVLSVGPGIDTSLYLRHPHTAAGELAQAGDLAYQLVDVMSLPVLALAAVGVVVAARRRARSLLLLLSSLGFLVILMPVGFSRIHYLLPVALPLCPFVGAALAHLVDAGGARRLAGLGLAVLCLGYLSLRSVDLLDAMVHDSRYAATDWLDAHTQPGDAVAYFGAPLKNPHLRADVASFTLEIRDEARATLVRERPEWVLVIPEDTNERRERVAWRQGPLSVRNDYVTPSVWRDLADGSLGYRLVARFQSPRLLPGVYRPFLSYATVNPPVTVFVREDRAGDLPRLEPWKTAPFNPRVWRVNEPAPDRSPEAPAAP